MSVFSIFKRRKSNPDFNKKRIENKNISEKNLKNIFSDCGDFESRIICCEGNNRLCAAALWIDGLVNSVAVSEDFIRPFAMNPLLSSCSDQKEVLDLIMAGQIYSLTARRRDTLSDVVGDILAGHVVLVFDSIGQAASFDIRTLQSRSISEPTVEKTLKGSKCAFVETLRVNTSLVRRYLRSNTLKLIPRSVGRKSATAVALMYVQGVAQPEKLAEAISRLDSIDIDGLLSAGNLEQYIVDKPASPFPQLIHTERPDKFAMELLAGRIGIIVDGLPMGFLLPATLPGFLRVGDDRAGHFLVASFLCLIRWLSLVITLTLPALFAAMNMYHQEMLPSRLLLSIIEARQQVPFSAAMELIGMLLAFELLQEAGLRLPNPVGDTVSIIGALIVGQAAVEARLVSPVTVIVVATAGICSFTLPSQDLGGAVRILRLGMVLLAVCLGLYGLMLGIVLLIWHLCSIESFGLAYTAPLSEGYFLKSLGAVLRFPLYLTKRRDGDLAGRDRWNQK